MLSTMQDAPLLIRDIVLRGEQMYATKKIFTVTPTGVDVATFAEQVRVHLPQAARAARPPAPPG